MQFALNTIHQGTTDLLLADVALVQPDDLGPYILTMQAESDRIRIAQSRLLAEADRHRIWRVSGHRCIEDWLAANGKTTLGAAGQQKKLGAALGKSKELADAVEEARTPGPGEPAQARSFRPRSCVGCAPMPT